MLIQNISSSTSGSAPIRLPSDGGATGVVVQTDTVHATVPQQTQQTSPAQLQNEVSKINNALQQNNKNLELSISVDSATHKQIVKLTDKDTGDTLLQYPSEAVLAIAKGIDEFQQGLLLKQQA